MPLGTIQIPNFDKPGIAVFDMDSTLITIECIDEIAALAGRKAAVSAITQAAMQGKIDFKQSLLQRVEALAGVNETDLTTLFTPIPLTHGAQELIMWLQQRGWRCVIASGGFTWFAMRLAQALNIDTVVANQLEIDSAGKLTGKIIGNVVDAEAKAQVLRDCCQKWNIPISQTMAVGDGANDRLMLEVSQLGVAFCAHEALKLSAQLVIDESSLLAVVNRLVTKKF